MENYRKTPVNLRAHHGMCLRYFVGKGYSSQFVENMAYYKKFLEEDSPEVRIIASVDAICMKCPNNADGECTSCGKVHTYDMEVLKELNLNPGSAMPFLDFYEQVREKILLKGKRSRICGSCQWDAYCREEIET